MMRLAQNFLGRFLGFRKTLRVRIEEDVLQEDLNSFSCCWQIPQHFFASLQSCIELTLKGNDFMAIQPPDRRRWLRSMLKPPSHATQSYSQVPVKGRTTSCQPAGRHLPYDDFHQVRPHHGLELRCRQVHHQPISITSTHGYGISSPVL